MRAPAPDAVVAPEHRPLRLAMFSPVPPIPSGISAYLADLLPLLPAAWCIDVFTDAGIDVDDAALHRDAGAPVRCLSHTDFAARSAEESYDLNIYQVGNTAARAYVLDYVTAHPGLLVLHDGVLHPARVEAAIGAGDVSSYRRMAARCRDDVGAAIGHLVAGGLGGPAIFRTFPMCEDLVRASRATAMHGELSCAWLRGLVPGAKVLPLVHWRSVRVDTALRDAWRRRLGRDEDVIIGALGNVGPERRLDRILHALAELPASMPWKLVIAGAVSPELAIEQLAAELGIEGRIARHPDLNDADFLAVVASIDFAVNLRYPPARASSGVLHQLLALGVPAVISDVMHWREYPDAAVLRVPPGPDDAEHRALCQALRRWIGDPEARTVAGAAAAAWAAAHLTPEKMRNSYVGAVSAALATESAR